MLIMNGTRESSIPMTFMGDALYGATQVRWLRPFDQLALFIGEGGFSDLTALTDGNYPPACWKMPKTAGALSAKNRVICEAVCTATPFWTMTGLAEGTSLVTGSGYVVAQGSGTAAGDSTATGALSGYAWCSGVAAGSAVATLTSYATGALAGHIYVSESDATVVQIVDGVWNAETADYDEPGSMGEALAAAGTAGDPWTTSLPGSYTDDQAGNIIGKKLLTTGKFIALK